MSESNVMVPDCFAMPQGGVQQRQLINPTVFEMTKFLLGLWKLNNSWELPMTEFIDEQKKVGCPVKYGDEAAIAAFKYLLKNRFIDVHGSSFLGLFDHRVVTPTYKLLQFYELL